VSRGGYFFHRPIIDELLSPVIGEALRFRSPLAACSASMSSCLRSASRLALAAESFAAAALSAHLLASCRRCSERVLILQVTDYFAATALPGAFGEVGPLTVRALRQLQDAESVAAICCHGRAAMQARGREWGDGAMLALLAAMVIVMAVPPQKLAVGRCWFQCHRIRTQHERPRRHCARERTERDRTIEGTLVAM
jgi:hypothetical protein